MLTITDKEKSVLTALVDMKLISKEQKEVLKGILDRIDGKNSYELYVDGAADLHSKTAGIGGVIYRDKQDIYILMGISKILISYQIGEFVNNFYHDFSNVC